MVAFAGLLAWLATTAVKQTIAQSAVGSIVFGLGYGTSVNLGYNLAHSFTQGSNSGRQKYINPSNQYYNRWSTWRWF